MMKKTVINYGEKTLNTDDYRIWKSKIVNKANELAYTSPEWGCNLSKNCLPVSLMVLDEARKSFPNAKVVIGGVLRNKNAKLSTSLIKEVTEFFSSTPLQLNRVFTRGLKLITIGS
jgi:hypothetical protein